MDESLSRSSSVVEEEEVFEITDFTTVSDWERFIAQVTEAVSDWQLTCADTYKPLQKHELASGKWEQLSREIRFSSAIFMLTLYQLKQPDDEEQYFEESESSIDDDLHFPACMQDMMSMDNDYPPRAHCLVRWYGFRSFVVLSLISSGASGSVGLISESKCNLLLSSACIVLSEAGCEVPLFIQIQQNWRKMFTGRCIGTGAQTEFEMIHLKKCPPQYRNLSGLLHIFKSKVGRIISPVSISARFTYILSNWGSHGAWPKEPIDPDVAAQTLDKLIFGCLDDPVSDLHLSAVWPSVYDNMFVENDVHSDFNPLIAPMWTVKVSYADNPECLMSSYLRDLLKLVTSTETFNSLIKYTLKENEQDIGQALSKLTDSSHKVKQIVPLMPELTMGISKIVGAPKSVWANRMKSSSHTTTGPLSLPMLELVMDFLFPEGNTSPEEPLEDKTEGKGEFSHKLEHQLKSAPKQSLTYRLATCLTVMNYCHGGLPAVAQVWHEFVQEMRYRFENGIAITGMTSENPDLRCCLLHQKLQMLNCCIQHKVARESKQSESFEAEPNVSTHKLECSADSHTGSEEATEKTSDSEQQSLILQPGSSQEVVNEEQSLTSSGEVHGDADHLISQKSSEAEELSVNQSSTIPSDLSEISGADEALSTPNVAQRSTSLLVAERKDSSTSQKSSGWQEEVSSIEDEFFDCDDGDAMIDEAEGIPTSFNDLDQDAPSQKGSISKESQICAVEQTMMVGNKEIQQTKLEVESEELELSSSNIDESKASNVDIPTDHTMRPDGRLELFENSNLQNFSEPLYVPVTQEPAPLTEDMLEEQTRIFSSLGDSVEGASLRRKMQSASLLSDMESFKAANPGCVLVDFVRWYSPRDYEEINGRGQLSERMNIPGNLWRIMWDTAKSIPARRQKRLFDDTKEGEKVLHFLSSLQPKDLILHILPICFHEAISVLERESASTLPSIPTLCGQILKQSCKLFQGKYVENSSQMEDILQKIQFMETLIGRAMSLKHKFQNVPKIDTFIRSIIENPEVSLDNAASGEIGNIIKQYFLDQATAAATPHYSTEKEALVKVPSFPSPIGKEYILRTVAPKPAYQSRNLPHRMYAVLTKGEFRLAGAFSSDTVFF